MQTTPPPVALTIAGSDNSAGAGMQADLKSFAAHRVYGLTAVTCVVAEIPGHVSMVEAMPAALVREQITLALSAFPVAAIKTGMLFSTDIIRVVAQLLYDGAARAIPLVVDPVMVASSGDPLLEPDAVKAYKSLLFSRATLVTPNLDEARTLSGLPIASPDQLADAGKMLAESYGAAFLMKGGHFGGDTAVDVLVLPGGDTHRYEAAFVPGVETHGTGCTFSAAITAGLARGRALPDAVADAKQFITRAIAGHHAWQRPQGITAALDHFA
jgi:hydroxymethylpyrimidine/phosphomethylpyrimidine kinase